MTIRHGAMGMILLCLVGAYSALAKPLPPNGLALTPPMGWNTWNKYGCDIDEATIRRQADAMVSSGMKAAGYSYVVIDDCWQGERDAMGNIGADSARFPSGIKSLADYVHGRGLKFGIYSDAGDKTCQKRPGSRGHEFQDAIQYAAWGVDYLKYDWCNSESLDAKAAYETMALALRASGRPIVFSICEWGTNRPWLWAASVGGNSWRTTGDIYDAWERITHDHEWFGVLDILDLQVGLDAYAGPGHWNDPDMLEVGNGGMSPDEYRAHFALWAMLSAPLIAGNDLATMNAETAAILTNREIIAVDQDKLGVQARRAAKLGDAEVWVKPLTDGAQAVLLLNRSTTRRTIVADWETLRLPSYLRVEVRDLQNGVTLKPAVGRIRMEVAPHAAAILKLKPAHGGSR